MIFDLTNNDKWTTKWTSLFKRHIRHRLRMKYLPKYEYVTQ